MPNASKHTLKPAPLTDEQIKMNQARFLMQKRETFAQGALWNLCNNPAYKDTAPVDLVAVAVDMADALIKALFVDPLPDFGIKKEGAE